MNRLYYGDCLTIMQEMRSASVDLIYLDPPFNSNRAYHAIYKDATGRPLPDQIEAFCDMWTLDEERERAIRKMPILVREAGVDDSVAQFWQFWMNALRNTHPRLLAYLSYMVERLLQMKSILKPTGSIYLHCDPTASHYLKVMMDGIFGHDNFRNEIVWFYDDSPGRATRWFSRKHDIILGYTKLNKDWFFNGDNVRIPIKEESIERYKSERKIGGKSYVGGSETKIPEDVWKIPVVKHNSYESTGYRTQKPLKLVDRIIKAACPDNGTVLDPFCGCATTLESAHTLGRKWIGIDIAIHAVKRVARIRLQHRLGLVEGQDFTIDGVPRNMEGARDLWERDKYHFQKWAVEEVEGFVTAKRTADGGIDGRLYFPLPNEPDLQSMAIEVKGGKNISIKDLRALKGVLDNDLALVAGLITMDPLKSTKERNFRQYMAQVGDLIVNNIPYPRMQMLSVPEIFEGKRFHTPGVVGKGQGEQIALPGTIKRGISP